MLQNKFGITKTAELVPVEERITKAHARELYDSGEFQKTAPTFAGLASIHKKLFKDIYDFAGETRTVEVSKGNVRFTPLSGLKTGLEFVDIMPSGTFEDIIDKYIEMNIAHPFRAGNGRCMRIWLNAMLYKIGCIVDFSRIDRREFKEALAQSSVDDEKLYFLLKGALTDDLGREAYMRSLDGSFAIEGYNNFRTSEI